MKNIAWTYAYTTLNKILRETYGYSTRESKLLINYWWANEEFENVGILDFQQVIDQVTNVHESINKRIKYESLSVKTLEICYELASSSDGWHTTLYATQEEIDTFEKEVDGWVLDVEEIDEDEYYVTMGTIWEYYVEWDYYEFYDNIDCYVYIDGKMTYDICNDSETWLSSHLLRIYENDDVLDKRLQELLKKDVVTWNFNDSQMIIVRKERVE